MMNINRYDVKKEQNNKTTVVGSKINSINNHNNIIYNSLDLTPRSIEKLIIEFYFSERLGDSLSNQVKILDDFKKNELNLNYNAKKIIEILDSIIKHKKGESGKFLLFTENNQEDLLLNDVYFSYKILLNENMDIPIDFLENDNYIFSKIFFFARCPNKKNIINYYKENLNLIDFIGIGVLKLLYENKINVFNDFNLIEDIFSSLIKTKNTKSKAIAFCIKNKVIDIRLENYTLTQTPEILNDIYILKQIFFEIHTKERDSLFIASVLHFIYTYSIFFKIEPYFIEFVLKSDYLIDIEFFTLITYPNKPFICISSYEYSNKYINFNKNKDIHISNLDIVEKIALSVKKEYIPLSDEDFKYILLEPKIKNSLFGMISAIRRFKIDEENIYNDIIKIKFEHYSPSIIKILIDELYNLRYNVSITYIFENKNITYLDFYHYYISSLIYLNKEQKAHDFLNNIENKNTVEYFYSKSLLTKNKEKKYLINIEKALYLLSARKEKIKKISKKYDIENNTSIKNIIQNDIDLLNIICSDFIHYAVYTENKEYMNIIKQTNPEYFIEINRLSLLILKSLFSLKEYKIVGDCIINYILYSDNIEDVFDLLMKFILNIAPGSMILANNDSGFLDIPALHKIIDNRFENSNLLKIVEINIDDYENKIIFIVNKHYISEKHDIFIHKDSDLGVRLLGMKEGDVKQNINKITFLREINFIEAILNVSSRYGSKDFKKVYLSSKDFFNISDIK